jgi:polyhydroxyalkanoate synthesis repressor PhaR
MRIIKKYANRKLYDTAESRYVTLDQLADLVRQGEDLKVVEQATETDRTSSILAQIIFEEEKRSPRLPIEGLRQSRTEPDSESAVSPLRNPLPRPSRPPRDGRVFP